MSSFCGVVQITKVMLSKTEQQLEESWRLSAQQTSWCKTFRAKRAKRLQQSSYWLIFCHFNSNLGPKFLEVILKLHLQL